MHSLSLIRPELLVITPEQLRVLAPYFWLLVGTGVGIFLSVFKKASPKWLVYLTSF
jgi:hypothetical protein